MFPALGAISAATSLIGGFLQKDAIQRATQERLRQMRLQAAQHIGAYEAGVGASGVEATSSTVQNHITRMSTEYANQMKLAQEAGDQASANAMMSAAGNAFGSFASNLQKASQLEGLLGEPVPKRPVNPFLAGKMGSDLSPGGAWEGWT